MRTRFAGLLILMLATQMQAAAAFAPQVEAVRAAFRDPDPEVAADAADAAIAALPNSTDAWFFSAGAYGRMAQAASIFTKLSWAKKSLEAYQQAVALDPRHFDAQLGLMQYYLAAPGIAGGGRDLADAQAATIAKIDAGWGHRALALLAQVDEDEAVYEREARAAIAADPAESRHRVALAQALASKERWDDAFRAIDEGLVTQNEDPRLNYQVGRLAALSGKQLERGLSALQAASLAPTKPSDFSEGGLHWRRAQILEKLGRKDEALPEYQRAATLEPSLQEQIDADLARMQKG